MRRRILFIAASVVIALICFVILLGLITIHRITAPLYPTLSDVMSRTGIAFPANAVLLESELDRYYGGGLRAKIQFESADMQSFLRGLSLQRDSAPSPELFDQSGGGKAWWDASSTSVDAVYTGNFPRNKGSSRGWGVLLISKPQGKHVLIYLLQM